MKPSSHARVTSSSATCLKVSLPLPPSSTPSASSIVAVLPAARQPLAQVPCSRSLQQRVVVTPIQLGLRANWRQFTLLVAVNAFVGAMVGLERSTLSLLAAQDFGLVSRTVLLSF